MSQFLPKSIQRLIDEFSRLPGIGPKSAERLAIHLLHSPEMRIQDLGKAILEMKDGVGFCETCWHLSDENPCSICSDDRRDHSIVAVVEQVLDVVAIERTGAYNGLYHVLHGALSPIDGIGPEDLKMMALEKRVRNEKTVLQEVILAMNPNLEGETTALYITKILAGIDIQLTRIARGLPAGGELGYADQITLSRALDGRMAYRGERQEKGM